MNCEQIASKLVPYLLKDLPDTEQEAVRQHLKDCESCRASARELEPTLELLGGALAAPFEAPAALDETRRDKIFATEPAPPPAKKPVLLHPLFLQAAAVIALLLVGAALLLPSMSRSAKQAMTIGVEVDERIDMAKLEKQVEHIKAAPRRALAEPDMTDDFGGGVPVDPPEEAAPADLPPPPKAPSPNQPSGLAATVDNKPGKAWQIMDRSGLVRERKKRPAFAGSSSARATEGRRDGDLARYEYEAKAALENFGDDLKDLGLDQELAGVDAPDHGMDKKDLGWSDMDSNFSEGLARAEVTQEKYKSSTRRGSRGGAEFDAGGKPQAEARPVEIETGGGGNGVIRWQNIRDDNGRGSREKSESASKTTYNFGYAMDEVPGAEEAEATTLSYYAKGGSRTITPAVETHLRSRAASGPAPTAKPAPAPRARDRMPDPFSSERKEDIGGEELRRDKHGKVAKGKMPQTRAPTLVIAGRKRANENALRPDSEPVAVDSFGLADGGSIAAPVEPVPPRAPEVELSKVAGTIANGTYTIRPGDTLSSIAESKNIPMDKIAELNRIENLDVIKTGQMLALPGGEMAKKGDKVVADNQRLRQREIEQKIRKGKALLKTRSLVEATEIEISSGSENLERIEKEIAELTEEVILSEAETSDDTELPVLGDLSVSGRLVKNLDIREEADGEGADRGEISEPVFRAYSFNPYIETKENAFSTFSIDVDTAAYTLARRYMVDGSLPPPDAVRTEEFLNFFNYNYPAPKFGTFAVYSEAAPSPLGSGYLLKVGIKGKRIGREEQRNAYLTFVIDTSGSMDTKDRLGLARKSLKLLVDKLGPQDQVAIVQYSSQSRLVLEHTPASQKQKILEAINALQVSGSTHLEQGLTMGYQVAARVFDPMAINRVLLVSDGAANLGAASAEEILNQVESYRNQGIFCSIFGFGIGTYNDVMLETLANKGNGSYQFIDSEEEARRVFVDDLSATLNTIASDVKIQVEFNPERVQQYRQLGYENRQLTKQQFRDDTVDAGEVGSGQSVTALYEIHLQGDPNLPLGTVRVRYRNLDTGEVEEIARPISAGDLVREFDRADSRFRLAAAVASFAEKLRGSPFTDHLEYRDIAGMLRPVAAELELDGYVQELSRLVQAASNLPRAAE